MGATEWERKKKRKKKKDVMAIRTHGMFLGRVSYSNGNDGR